MTILIVPNDRRAPVGKLADVELHFSDGPLTGLRLIGFAVWERTGNREYSAGRTVTFPARVYAVNGERRSFALLRPTVDMEGQERLRAAILDTYARHEREALAASEDIKSLTAQAKLTGQTQTLADGRTVDRDGCVWSADNAEATR